MADDSESISSTRQSSTHRNIRPEGDRDVSERTPLLLRRNEGLYDDGDDDDSASSSSREDLAGATSDKRKINPKWPTAVALFSLCLAVVVILVVGFAAPSVMKEYAEEAAVFEPEDLSITEFTSTGVRTRIQGRLVLDASRVKIPIVRNIGRFGTWISKEVETGETEVEVYLPEYGNVLLGTVDVPPIKANVRDGYENDLDFIAELTARNLDGIRGIVNDWLGGRLGQLRIRGKAIVPLKSGLLSLGSQTISDSIVFQEVASFPDFNITKLNIHERSKPGQPRSINADVSLSVQNNYPIQLTIPPLQFDIFVPNCSPGDSYIMVANATTELVDIKPRQQTMVSLHGFAHEVPEALINICPGSSSSPLDILLQNYIHGFETIIYVRGGTPSSSTTPQWLEDLLSSTTIPVPFTSHGLSHLIKRFSMTNVHFDLPDPFAEPDTPEAQPKVSSLVQAVVDLPKEMNFPLNVSRVRTVADIYYQEEKLGYIDLQKWQNATASPIKDEPDGLPAMLIEFDINEAPLQVTDEDIFTDVLQKLIFERKAIPLQVKAKVAAELDTVLGQFVVRDIPASGGIVIKPPASGGLTNIKPKIESLKVADTTNSSILVQTVLNFTNPTNYSAHVPYMDLKLVHNSTDVAHIIVRDLTVNPGLNSRVKVDGLWNPLDSSGEKGVIAGRDLLSQFVSGYNTTITVRSFNGSLPTLPVLGQALSRLEIELPVPKLRFPGGDNDNPPGDEGGQGFIRDATLHLFSSTADFTLISPLPSTTLHVTEINATAFFNHTSPVGKIQYDAPFAVPPGSSRTPRLPVELDLGGAGYQALKDALGGTLEIDAVADINVKLGEYLDKLYYRGKGIGARVRL